MRSVVPYSAFAVSLLSIAALTHAAGAADPAEPIAKTLAAYSPEASFFIRLKDTLGTPALRKALEPAGAWSYLRLQENPIDLVKSWRAVRKEEIPALAEQLLTLSDPLAARLAVSIAGADESLPEVRKAWLEKALVLFPEDPELLMSRAVDLASADGVAARSAFEEAMRGFTSLAPFHRESGPLWCGLGDYSEGERAEPWMVAAIVGFAERVNPPMLPRSWVQVLEKTLADPARMTGIKPLSPAALTLSKYRGPWPSGMGPDHFPWTAAVEAMAGAGETKAAAQVAEAALRGFGGTLKNADPSLGPAFAVRPWEPGGGALDYRTSDGWRWLLAAKEDDPAGLADRLLTLSRAKPADEQAALTALLALAQVRPLTAEVLAEFSTMPLEGRRRVLAHASRLLDEHTLPPALCLDAWEAMAAELFTADGEHLTRNFQQGLGYAERIPGVEPGTDGILPRLVPGMLDRLARLPEPFPFESISKVIRLVELSQEKAANDTLSGILDARVKSVHRDAEGITRIRLLAISFPSVSAMPPALAKRVEATLQSAAQNGWNSDEDGPLSLLATVAAAHPPWHAMVRKLVKDGKGMVHEGTPHWAALRALFQTLDEGLALPDVGLVFQSTAPGEGTLHWNFQGIRLPAVENPETGISSRPAQHAWTPLTADMAGKFDATVLVEAQGSRESTVAGKTERLPASGSLELKGLPPTGRLRLRLDGNSGRRPSGESRVLGYNSLSLVVESPGGQPVVAKNPGGWRLLTKAVQLTETRHWHVKAGNGSPPAGVRMLFLDESGEVCGISGDARETGDAPDEMEDFRDYSGLLISRSAMTLTGSPDTQPLDGGLLRITGAPATMALGISERTEREIGWTPAVEAADGEIIGSQFHEEPPWLTPLTVRTWPASPRDRGTGTRLEIVRGWSRADLLVIPPVIGTRPLRAAWGTSNHLHVVELEGPSAHSPKVLTRKVETEDISIADRLAWQGIRLNLFAYSLPDDEGKRTTRLTNLDPSHPDSLPVTHVFEGHVSAFPNDSGELDYLPLIQAWNTPEALAGVLAPDARLLAWPESAGAPPKAREMAEAGKSGLLFRDSGGIHRLVDWSDGTLRVKSAGKPAVNDSPRHERIGARLSPEEAVAVFGPLPLSFRTVVVLGEGRFLGIGTEPALSLTLLRQTQTSKPQ